MPRAGRGFTRPGPQGQDEGYIRSEPPGHLEYDSDTPPVSRSGDCPLHMWGGPGHSAPFRGCAPDGARSRMTLVKCTGKSGCDCRYHQAIREARLWHRWLSRRWPAVQRGTPQPDREMEAGQ